MLDILRPATSAVKTSAASPRPVSPLASPASSTSTLKASNQSRSDHARSTSKSSTGTTARSKGQQARRLSIESAVASSHRHRYSLQGPQHALLDPNSASSSSSRSFSSGLGLLRRPTSASESHPSHHARGRSKLARSSNVPPASHSASLSASSTDPHRDEHSRTRKRSRAQKPLLGGLYFSDLIVVAFFYAVNLLRTCGIAELVDVAFKAFTYVCTRLPFDFYQRWSLSRPPSTQFGWYAPLTSSASSAIHATDSRSMPESKADGPSRWSRGAQDERTSTHRTHSGRISSSTAVSALASSSDEETTSQEALDDDTQLSPFHHLTLLLVRFACTSFPHLVPRVLFAEETIGPLVRWRTGGGAAGIVREFTNESSTSPSAPALARSAVRGDPSRSGAGNAAPSDRNKSSPKSAHSYTRPGFRAFWIGADAHVPVEVRRSDPSSKSASTLLYLHGGGFSLGSVAFYAEALIRIITKVCAIEDRDNDARCVAVEYDLGPTSRFPGPLLQCLRCYAHLIEVEGVDPVSITIAGDSAGGNLTMAMLLCLDGQARGDPRLAERDWSALPMPGKAVLISPWADLRPSASLAFSHLRQAAAAAPASSSKQTHSHSDDVSGRRTESASVRISAWTEALGQHEWDYVAAEALMHFAQLYAGVLKTPRRVRGPMGWVAHMCAVLAGDDDDGGSAHEDSRSSTRQAKNAKDPQTPLTRATAPLAILRTLLSPPQRVARAAHSMLTEPLLNRATTAKKPTSSPRAGSNSDAFNQIEHIRPSAVGALDPIFPAAERKTDAVASTADLYIPIWDDRVQDGHQEKEKREATDPDFEEAKALLETSKLVNPAIGDWSRIALQRGMLVVWGDRERLADDIEAWIDHVRQSQSARSGRRAADSPDDKPGQDVDPSQRFTGAATSHTHGQSLQERRAASRSPHRPATPDSSGQAVDWLCTAVEHGPGGVHAWPFVSMYLAGSEAEREKGLEILARFIAEPTPSPSSTVPPTPTSSVVPLAVQLPGTHQQRYLSAAANSPPHLNAVSPAGSMPSDISSRGDADDQDYPFLGSSYTESEGWDADERNELGLEGVYPHETVWTQPTPTPSTGVGTLLDSDMERESIGHDELVRRVGLGLGGNEAVGTRESVGRAMEPVRLHHPAHQAASSWSQQQQSSRPQQRSASTPSQHRSSSSTTAFYSSTQGNGAAGGGRSLADLEAESDMSAPPSRPDSPGAEWRENERGYDSVEEDEDDLDAPSPGLDRDAYFGSAVSYADDAIPMDPGFYGLAHYHTLRPEGLSDIAEEESQLDTSSVLSSGYGALSPGSSEITFSPHDGRSPNIAATRAASTNPGRYASAYTPSASEMARLREALDERERQYQQRFARGGSRFPIEDDDDDDDESIGEGHGSDGDVDWLDMDDQAQQQQTVSPWRSSAELPNLSALQEQQQGASRGPPQAAQQGAFSAAPAATLSIKVDDFGSGPSQGQAGESDVQPPPSPARSTSSQASGSRDVWW
ncbi:uncharacterized protein SRS1_15941 [Sporisorium reilianum f. sp. reilianum]|uniref:Alpha/beta hydrolase fold-3 domain-containing protein n=1 Tax=Sporisorium reilianum f. sp. reilianum TaxID=72559 RepID=A0A2N8UK28_9BASI|nr:uncharacterized protein SRS1_15941 [Sporisorium reilianum f. sp. reilianum]